MASTKITRHNARKDKLESLTDRQKLFVSEYLIDQDAANAAKRAGYKSDSMAGKLMRNPIVSKAIGKALNERLEANEMTAERLLKELSYAALRDPLDLCDKNGVMVLNDLRKLPARMRRCIDGIKIRNTVVDGEVVGQEYELKLCPKLASIELAMKAFGMLTEKREIRAEHTIDFDALLESGEYDEDPIEGLILEAEGRTK